MFPAHGQICLKLPQMGSGGFFPTNLDLADILDRTDFDLDVSPPIAICPKRLNRAHWPTKENRQNLSNFWIFRPTQKMGREGPKWGGDAFFRHRKILPTFWAERILILRIFVFWIFLGPKFLAWAHLGPTWAHLGPAWAHPLGPHVGPPTWAPRGPTHLGPSGGPLGWALGWALKNLMLNNQRT